MIPPPPFKVKETEAQEKKYLLNVTLQTTGITSDPRDNFEAGKVPETYSHEAQFSLMGEWVVWLVWKGGMDRGRNRRNTV